MSTAAKTELLAASAAQDIPALVDLFERNGAKKDELDLADVLSTLSSKETAKLWEGLEQMTVAATEQLFAEEEPTADAETLLALMRGFCWMIQTVDKQDLNARAALPCLAALHDVLLELGNFDSQLQVSIARLCESWWVKEQEGAELLIPQLLPFLLLSALEPTARDADVKRLHAVRKAFLLLDFNDESIESIRDLLLRTVVQPAFLKCVEGNRFLGFLFTIHSDVVPLLHRAIREQLPHAPAGILKAYGELYVRAWKEASADGATVQVVEECIQSIMHAAIHAARRPLFGKLRIVLSVIHEQKVNAGFDTLLLQLYSPILWRSLRCANAVVRAQACTLFFDVFPLQDANASAEQSDALLQRQFDVLAGLLRDQDPRVRIPAVSGVCKMLSVFWESIPLETIKEILGFVVGTLGVDASSAPVRVAVVNGVSTLFDNPLAHTVLKPVLPLLANCIHDSNARVRLAFVELLSKLKLVKGVKFYKIVPVEHLLARLKEDAANASIVKAMTSLLLNSYYPQTGANAGGEQLRRCLAFLEQDVDAATVFYSNLFAASSVGSAVKLCVLLLRCLSSNVALPAADQDAIGSPNDTKHQRSKRKHNSEAEDDGVISDPILRTGMLRILDSTLRSIAAEVKSDIEAPSREMIQQFFSFQVLQELYDAAVVTDADLPFVLRVVATVGPLLSSHTSKKSSQTLLEKLMRDPTSWIQLLVEGQTQPQLKTALIQLCCAQGREAMIVDVVCTSLAEGGEHSVTPARQKKGTKKATPTAADRLPVNLAIEVLGILLRDSNEVLVEARERCITDDQQYNKLHTALGASRAHCERLIWSSDAVDTQVSESTKMGVMLAWELELQRIGLQRKHDNEFTDEGFSSMLQWFEERVISGFVRTSDDDDAPSTILQEVTAASLTVVAEAVLCELLRPADFERLSNWAGVLAGQRDAVCQLPLFPAVCRLAYQVVLKDKALLATEPLLRLVLQGTIPEEAVGDDDVVSKDARRTVDAVISCCIAPGPKLAASRKGVFVRCLCFVLEGLNDKAKNNTPLDTILLSQINWTNDHSCAVAELLSKNFKSCKLIVEDLARYLKNRLAQSNEEGKPGFLPAEQLDRMELSKLTQLLAAFVRGSSEECQEQLHPCLVELSGHIDGMAAPALPSAQKARPAKRGVLQTKNAAAANDDAASDTPQPKGRRRRQTRTPSQTEVTSI